MIADTVLTNGKIYTMDKDNTVVESIAINANKIIFTGSDSEVKSYISSHTKVVDVKGNTVLPGLIETHVHVPGNAYNVLHNIDLYDAKTAEETEAVIERFIKEHPEKNRYYGKGFKTSVFPGTESTKGPKKERLDRICSDKPIGIIDEGGHICWLNSKALELAGITETIEEIDGGIIEKDEKTGELWGILKDEAKKLFPEQQFSPEEKREAYQWFQDLFTSYGYTSILAMRQSASSDPTPILETIAYFDEQDQLNLRVASAREIKVLEDEYIQINDLAELKKKYHQEGGKIKVTTAKFFLDGTVEGLNAFLSEPYSLEAGKGENYCGELFWDEGRLKATFIEVLSRGFNIHIHAIGDEAVSKAVEALEIAQEKVKGDHRNCITHLQLVHADDFSKMAELNIIACVNPYWHFKEPSVYFDGEEVFLGKERAETEYPLKSFIDHGVIITCSADYPSSPYPNPFFAIQAGVTRNLYDADYFGAEKITDENDPKWRLNPEERAGVLELVKGYTIDAAYAMHMEDEIGSIECGKKADVIVIDRDIFAIDHLDIENTKVLKTFFDGREVYSCKK